MLFGFIAPPRLKRMTGPYDPDRRCKTNSARGRCGCIGMRRPERLSLVYSEDALPLVERLSMFLKVS